MRPSRRATWIEAENKFARLPRRYTGRRRYWRVTGEALQEFAYYEERDEYGGLGLNCKSVFAVPARQRSLPWTLISPYVHGNSARVFLPCHFCESRCRWHALSPNPQTSHWNSACDYARAGFGWKRFRLIRFRKRLPIWRCVWRS